MIPRGLLDDIAARKRTRSLDAVGQTDQGEGQLQLSTATTVPLQDNPTDSQPGQLQQSNPSTDSPRVRSIEGSISSLASTRVAGIEAGIRSVAVSPAYATIFYEIARIQAAFPSCNIEIINAEDQMAKKEVAEKQTALDFYYNRNLDTHLEQWFPGTTLNRVLRTPCKM